MDLFLLASGMREMIQTSMKHMERPLNGRKDRGLISLRGSACYPGLRRGLARNEGYGGYDGRVGIGGFRSDFRPCSPTLGRCGVESKIFYNKCKILCKHHFRKMRCSVLKTMGRSSLGCARGLPLGSARAPSCYFYRRCFQLLPFYTKRLRLFQRRRRKAQDILRRKGRMNWAWNFLRKIRTSRGITTKSHSHSSKHIDWSGAQTQEKLVGKGRLTQLNRCAPRKGNFYSVWVEPHCTTAKPSLAHLSRMPPHRVLYCMALLVLGPLYLSLILNLEFQPKASTHRNSLVLSEVRPPLLNLLVWDLVLQR